MGAGDAGEDDRAVVVADDDPALRLLCRVNLEQDGYRVLEAASGDEVERILAAERVAVVLLDVHLGADDGTEIARRVKEHHPGVPIAFFTGSAPLLPEPIRALADGVVPKPFSLEELSGTVRLLARR
jgi:two-component system phosphate regulon response regulator PhoB